MRLVTAALIGLVVTAPLHAQEPVRQEREHVVKKGDTLWDLAGSYYTNPFQWPTIYQANTMIVEDPHWIYPEEVLLIPGLTGTRGEPGPRVVRRVASPAARTVFYRRPVVDERQSRRATVLSEPETMGVPVSAGEFASAPYLADPDDLEVWGQLIRPVRENRGSGRGRPVSAHPEDEVFVSYRTRTRPTVGDRFVLARVGGGISGAPGGTRVIEPRGVVRITELADDVMKARIEIQYGPVYPDELLIPIPMYPDFMVEEAEPVDFDVHGRILGFLDEQPLYSRSDVGFLDVGSRDGVKVGDVFHAYLPERASATFGPANVLQRIDRLPPEPVAELRVVRVTDRTATVTVDNLMQPLLEPGLDVWRVARIP